MGFGGAPSAGIEGLHPKVFSSFKGGRVTNMNLADMTDEMSLLAANVMFLGDRAVSKRPGYTLVDHYDSFVLAMHDFQRTSDQKQFLLVQVPGVLFAGAVDASFAKKVLSNATDPLAQFQFTDLDFASYCSNGKQSLRIVDNAGVITAYRWGLAPTNVAPIATQGVSTLTLTYGRTYVMCPVSKITDAQGITRVHVGAPSPNSNFTGPGVNISNIITGIPVSADPQVTHWWIFATYDTPQNSTSIFNFALEVVNGVTTATDNLPDVQLDPTRAAPFENFPAPLAEIVLQYESCIVWARIAGAPTFVQFSGYEEILLGLPQETAPASKFFQIPGGKQIPSAAINFSRRLMISTKEYWWQVQGYDASTFKKRDRVISPGAVGKKACIVSSTLGWMAWLAPDKNIYAWNGTTDQPILLSKKLAKQVVGIGLSMEDLTSAQIENAELRWYSFGRFSVIALLASTLQAPAGVHDWIQLWDTSFLGDTLSDNTVNLLAESDFFPSDLMSTSAIVNVADKDYIFLADSLGNVYRWPDGYLDNGKPFTPVWGSIWSGLSVFIGQTFHPLPPQEVVKRLFFADILTSRQDAVTAFQLLGIASQAPDNLLQPVDCGLDVFHARYGMGSDPTCARANLTYRQGVNIGKWARFFLIFPNDENEATLYRLVVSARPVHGLAP